MQTKHAAIVISVAILIAAYLLSGRSLFGPNNYEDCVLESMEGIVSNHAVYSIRDACKQKFSSGTDQSAITRLLSDVSSWFSKQEIPPPPPGYVLESELPPNHPRTFQGIKQAEITNEQRIRDEMNEEFLNKISPGWSGKVTSKEFSIWLKMMPQEKRVEVEDSNDVLYVAEQIKHFDAWVKNHQGLK